MKSGLDAMPLFLLDDMLRSLEFYFETYQKQVGFKLFLS